MGYHQNKILLQSQIVETEKLLELANGNPFIEISLNERLKSLKEQLENLQEVVEPKITLLFSGDMVYGSKGINTNFVSRTMMPIQNLIKLQTSIERYGKEPGKRGKIKGKKLSELYLTSLEKGSFGYELSLLNPQDIFEEQEVGESIQSVMDIIYDISADDSLYEKHIHNLPPRGVILLNSFFKELADSNSILKMESGSKFKEISKDQIKTAFTRISSTICEQEEIIIKAIFKGALIDTGKFELLSITGKKLNGDISPNLSQEEIAQLNKEFSNEECEIKMIKFITKYNNGTKKITFELLGISKN
ncbi:MAG: hypothetical protein J1F35_08925 [Erysipelotrichales bacterium]|nr:hypothetical protein [Erysipelotrichales bacterium]